MIRTKEEQAFIKNYVNSVCQVYLQTIDYFDEIRYARDPIGGSEFVKISDIAGDTMFLDVTDLEFPEITKEVARSLLMGEIEDPNIIPKSLIAGRSDRLAVAELFR